MLNMNAVRAYQQAEQEFLVDGSDPHRLVQILFTELLASMDRTTLALESNDLAAKSAASSKALTIVYVLATSLDFERGEPVATTLAKIYEWARRELIAANKDKPVERLTEIRRCMADIADAWSMIGKKSTKAA